MYKRYFKQTPVNTIALPFTIQKITATKINFTFNTI